MFDNKYPYTDFHELNLDWILEVVKRVETEWPEFKTTMETEWNTYKDGLTGEGGEWPTFKTQVETTVNNFIHDVVGSYNENFDYQQGMFCYHEGKVYKCLQTSSAAFPRPFNSYNWYSYENQNTNSVVNDLFNYLTNALNDQDNEIYNWIQRTAEQWNDTKPYVAGDYCSAHVGGVFIPSAWRYYKCIQDCTGIDVLDTNYWKEVIFASDVAETIAAYKQAMQDQYDQFLEDYQRTFGVVQTRGSSTTDVMSQKAVSDELDEIDHTFDDIESGQEVVGHARVSDNWTPWSEDSGAIQDTPFISQETGTANNTVIVTTGDTAKQLEKQGNTIVKNNHIQNGDFASGSSNWHTNATTPISVVDGVASFTPTAQYHSLYQILTNKFVPNHKMLCIADVKTSSANSDIEITCSDSSTFTNRVAIETTTSFKRFYALLPIPSTSTTATANVLSIRTAGTENFVTIYVDNVVFIDLTQWFNGNDNIPADLLANPSHFSWYYNGELTYNAGEIKHGEGVKLVCTRGRNLWDEQWELGGISSSTGANSTDNTVIRSKNYIQIVPNVPYYLYAPQYCYFRFYDANKNYINYLDATGLKNKAKNETFVAPNNAVYFRFVAENITTYGNNITLSPYYSPEQGGEGYEQYYPYEEPDIIDTGSEQLGAFDKKTPDGVIHDWTVNLDGGDVVWTKTSQYGHTVFYAEVTGGSRADNVKVVCSKYVNNNDQQYAQDKVVRGYGSTLYGFSRIAIRDDTYAEYTAEDFQTAMTGVKFEIQANAETTTQGSSFRQYADINDYGIMYWLGANDELVSIPQGLKIQYPVNYKGYVDDLYMYTNGDATALAKNESITDAALQARGYLKLTALSGYDATKTQTLKNVQGVFTWIDDQ